MMLLFKPPVQMVVILVLAHGQEEDSPQHDLALLGDEGERSISA
jgi:hypothetical protein